MQITLIHNPDAGDDEQPSGDEIIELIRGAGHTLVYQSTKENHWPSALKNRADIIAIAGGDGVVGQVAKRSVGRNVPIAVLPLGTANNIANTLGLVGKRLDQLIAGWTDADRLRFDVGVARGPWGSKYFIEGVGVGLFAEVMARLDARGNADLAHAADANEKLSSVLEMLNAQVPDYPAAALALTLDGRDLSGDYVLLEILNIRAVGPNLYFSPQADPGDGLLDIVSVSENDRDKLRAYLGACLEGKSCSLGLTVHRGKQLQLRWQDFTIHIDDDTWPRPSPKTCCAGASFDVTLGSASVIFLVPG